MTCRLSIINTPHAAERSTVLHFILGLWMNLERLHLSSCCWRPYCLRVLGWCVVETFTFKIVLGDIKPIKKMTLYTYWMKNQENLCKLGTSQNLVVWILRSSRDVLEHGSSTNCSGHSQVTVLWVNSDEWSERFVISPSIKVLLFHSFKCQMTVSASLWQHLLFFF